MARRRTTARAAYAVLALADTALAAGPDRHRHLRRLTKPALMPVLAAGLAGRDADRRVVRRTLLAQALSGGGDVALLGSGTRPFLAGLTSFLGAHLAYVSAFRRRSTAPLTSTATGRVALAAGAVVAPVMAVAAGRRDRTLSLPVAAYGWTLCTMVAASAAVPPGPGRDRLVAGTHLFLLSDTLLGVRTFVLGRRSPALDGAVMASYTAAQWCISEGVARG